MKKNKSLLAAVMMLAAVPAVLPSMTVAAKSYDGTYVIRNVNSGKFLNVEGGKAEAGTNVQQWGTDAAHAYDTWRIESDADGNYCIYSMLGGGKTLALTEDGGNIVLGDASGSEHFRLEANADGSFRLVTSGDKAVEVKDASTDAGANVQTWEQNGINCQDWEFIPVTLASGTETNCIAMSAPDYIPGDLNGDGVIDVFDLALGKRAVLAAQDNPALDLNADNACDVVDLVAMTRFLHTGEGGFRMREGVGMPRIYAASDGDYEKGFVESDHPGFTSPSYLNLYNEVGSDVTINVNAPKDGVYALTIHQANGGTADRGVRLDISGALGYYTLTGAPTGSWDTWAEETLYVNLTAGINTLTFTSLTADGASNFDTFTISDTDHAASPVTPYDPIKGVPVRLNKNVWGEGYQMEYLNRGLVAANAGNGMQLTWRILATDADNTSFKLYKNGTLLKEIAAGAASNYFDQGGTPSDKYTIDTYVGTTCTEKGAAAYVFGTQNSGQSGAYIDINTKRPADQTMPDGSTCSYTENDCSVGDIDGDGQYEVFVKWDPSNSQDNSKTGYTGTVFIDCYRLDGTMVWRVDLGRNIRAGAHYTQYMVYDFDGDGRCEMICKTADGTKDGKGNYVGDASKDYRSSAGTVLSGPEYITLFDGLTGAALDTQKYTPERGAQGKSTWGDDYGNRSERYTACVAYLDGQHPSAVFGRGYYTRLSVAAWDVVNKKLSQRWLFDTGFNVSAAGYGDGNHQEMGADVDGDGRQEIVCGSAVIDDNGKLLYTTSNAHGDAMHIGDFVPGNPGLEIFMCLEDEVHPNGKKINWGTELRDAKTGKALFRQTAGGDTGRCLADNLIAGNAGAEMIGSHNSIVYDCVTGAPLKNADGTDMTFANITKWGQNSVVYWTDVLERAVLDRTMADQYGKGRVFSGDGVTYNNYTKSNAGLTCDLIGDWREEMIFRKSDGGLRIFTTTFATEYPIYSLMHNPQYRVQVAAQNNAYNQPPHTDYFLGTGYDLPEPPTVYDYTADH
ncbi:MAG: RICIN domain-containing protein [Oscillospiraceae bacterium]|nr:RICIN domain-containing protein [Oscillospiraceae bacterium]